MNEFKTNLHRPQYRPISCSAWKMTLVATTLGLLAGCASTSSTTNSNQGAQYRWEKQGASDSDWNQDRGQCMAQGFSATGSNPAIASGVGNPAYTNIMFQQAMIFASCMQGKGWLRVQVR